MPLDDYRRKRRFDRTAEPPGEEAAAAGRIFVVQQHAARRLHFDFRLELDGALKSWAVPKGVSVDPADRRLAVHVEDHPVEYADFEGTIAEGEYGAGAVIVWDRGVWEPIGDPHKGYRDGKLKFHLRGEKLRGAWTLVRMRGRAAEDGDNWLLLKEQDDAAVPRARGDIVLERPESVLSGRTLAEVAASGDPPGKTASTRNSNGLLALLRETPGAKRSEVPASIEPALGRLAEKPPKGEEWLHEIKFDGYRILSWLDHGKAQLRTRHGHDWTKRFPEIAAAVERLPANLAVLDGEVVALSAEGISTFSALQQAHSTGQTGRLVYYLFDVLYLEGFDLRQVSLEARQAILQKLLERNREKRLQRVDHLVGGGAEFFEHCRRLGLEGMISKRRQSSYRSGRSDNWLKLKCVQSEPFVIGGFTVQSGRTQMRALIVGCHDSRGRLIYAGRVGGGFTEQTFADLQSRLRTIERTESPFSGPVPKESGIEQHWVRPQLVAQVQFASWTSEGILWHPTFEGLRDDTDPTEIVRERALEESPSGPSVASPVSASSRPSPPTVRFPSSPPGRGAGGEDRSPAPTVTSNSTAPPEGGTPTRGTPFPTDVLEQLKDVRLTSPQKVLYPDLGLTKLDLVRYYVQVADWVLPHVVDRPLTLVRCPDGVHKEHFYQQHAGRETPPEVQRIVIADEEGKSEERMFIRDLKGLVALVQVGTLEIHLWGARVDKPERPDRLIFDLDPDEAVPWARVIEGAARVRERLNDAGLMSFVKLTGGKGIHVVVPLERRQSWADAKRFTHTLAQGLAADYPQAYTSNMSKKTRQGRIYIDWVRNGRGATAVAPYSTRARAGAPVAAPLVWDELTADLRPDAYNVKNLAERLTNLRQDPWAELPRVRQALTSAILKKIK
jgi:bifunctional non-homologous end joining protein LigD